MSGVHYFNHREDSHVHGFARSWHAKRLALVPDGVEPLHFPIGPVGGPDGSGGNIYDYACAKE